MPAELILILVFVALSLLGAVADKGKQRGPGAPPPQAQRLPDGSVLLPNGRVIPADSPELEAFWWLPPAPAPHREALPRWDEPEPGVISLEPVDGFEPQTLEGEGRAWEHGREGRPEPVREVLEQPEVDRELLHERFHRRYVEPQPSAAAHARSSLLASLRGRDGLRQAVLAAEILGRPRSLRPPDDR